MEQNGKKIKTYANREHWLRERNRLMDDFTSKLQSGAPIDEAARALAESDEALKEMTNKGMS